VKIDSIPNMLKQIVALVQSDILSNRYHSKQAMAASICHTTRDVSVAHALIENKQIDLLIIELAGQTTEYFDFISYVTDISFPTKIAVIATDDTPQAQEICLSSGADLYLSQPVSERCIELYCNKLLHFNKHKVGTLLHLGEAALQPETAHLYIGSLHRQLRKREAEILAYFFRHKNQVITRSMLIDGIWGFSDEVPEFTTVDVYIRRLRMQLKNSHARLDTVRGVGYIAREFTDLSATPKLANKDLCMVDKTHRSISNQLYPCASDDY